MVHFVDTDGELAARVYRHYDGYPEGESGVLADLERFFGDVEKDAPGDTRFNDPEFLAAKFLVWQAWRNAHTHNLKRSGEFAKPKRLAFTGVAPAQEDHADCEYVYEVRTNDRILGGPRPSVTWREYHEEPDPENGPGSYRVRGIVAEGDLAGANVDVVWECNHRKHAENRARKRGIAASSIELLG
jgi:hypothetical protein